MSVDRFGRWVLFYEIRNGKKGKKPRKRPTPSSFIFCDHQSHGKLGWESKVELVDVPCRKQPSSPVPSRVLPQFVRTKQRLTLLMAPVGMEIFKQSL